MSDAPQGPGWWLASDGRFYPPQPVVAVGVNGQITFDGAIVAITRKGAVARMTIGKGEKRIPVTSISAIQLKPAGLVRGFIQFTVPGGNERRSQFGRQSTDAAKDENSVLFMKNQQPVFEALRAAVEQTMYTPQTVVHAAPPGAAAAPGLADQLAKIADLVQAGALTIEQAEAAKAKLLGM
jgi:hypothetical protein